MNYYAWFSRFFDNSRSVLMKFAVVMLTSSICTAQTFDLPGLMAAGDSAYAAGNNQLAFTHYQHAADSFPNSDTAAWKLARALVDVGESLEDKTERKSFFMRARDASQTAISLNPENGKAFLFYSIALGRLALDAGPRERIRLAKDIKQAVDRAVELDPESDIAWHVLGRWHHKIATLSWIERRFANIFLGGVPSEASVDEALACFLKATTLRPAIIAHQLELGNVYLELERREEAIAAYQKVLSLPPKDPEDPKYKRQASEHLKKLL